MTATGTRPTVGTTTVWTPRSTSTCWRARRRPRACAAPSSQQLFQQKDLTLRRELGGREERLHHQAERESLGGGRQIAGRGVGRQFAQPLGGGDDRGQPFA